MKVSTDQILIYGQNRVANQPSNSPGFRGSVPPVDGLDTGPSNIEREGGSRLQGAAEKTRCRKLVKNMMGFADNLLSGAQGILMFPAVIVYVVIGLASCFPRGADIFLKGAENLGKGLAQEFYSIKADCKELGEKYKELSTKMGEARKDGGMLGCIKGAGVVLEGLLYYPVASVGGAVKHVFKLPFLLLNVFVKTDWSNINLKENERASNYRSRTFEDRNVASLVDIVITDGAWALVKGATRCARAAVVNLAKGLAQIVYSAGKDLQEGKEHLSDLYKGFNGKDFLGKAGVVLESALYLSFGTAGFALKNVAKLIVSPLNFFTETNWDEIGFKPGETAKEYRERTGNDANISSLVDRLLTDGGWALVKWVAGNIQKAERDVITSIKLDFQDFTDNYHQAKSIIQNPDTSFRRKVSVVVGEGLHMTAMLLGGTVKSAVKLAVGLVNVWGTKELKTQPITTGPETNNQKYSAEGFRSQEGAWGNLALLTDSFITGVLWKGARLLGRGAKAFVGGALHWTDPKAWSDSFTDFTTRLSRLEQQQKKQASFLEKQQNYSLKNSRNGLVKGGVRFIRTLILVVRFVAQPFVESGAKMLGALFLPVYEMFAGIQKLEDQGDLRDKDPRKVAMNLANNITLLFCEGVAFVTMGILNRITAVPEVIKESLIATGFSQGSTEVREEINQDYKDLHLSPPKSRYRYFKEQVGNVFKDSPAFTMFKKAKGAKKVVLGFEAGVVGGAKVGQFLAGGVLRGIFTLPVATLMALLPYQKIKEGRQGVAIIGNAIVGTMTSAFGRFAYALSFGMARNIGAMFVGSSDERLQKIQEDKKVGGLEEDEEVSASSESVQKKQSNFLKPTKNFIAVIKNSVKAAGKDKAFIMGRAEQENQFTAIKAASERGRLASAQSKIAQGGRCIAASLGIAFTRTVGAVLGTVFMAIGSIFSNEAGEKGYLLGQRIGQELYKGLGVIAERFENITIHLLFDSIRSAAYELQYLGEKIKDLNTVEGGWRKAPLTSAGKALQTVLFLGLTAIAKVVQVPVFLLVNAAAGIIGRDSQIAAQSALQSASQRVTDGALWLSGAPVPYLKGVGRNFNDLGKTIQDTWKKAYWEEVTLALVGKPVVPVGAKGMTEDVEGFLKNKTIIFPRSSINSKTLKKDDILKISGNEKYIKIETVNDGKVTYIPMEYKPGIKSFVKDSRVKAAFEYGAFAIKCTVGMVGLIAQTGLQALVGGLAAFLWRGENKKAEDQTKITKEIKPLWRPSEDAAKAVDLLGRQFCWKIAKFFGRMVSNTIKGALELAITPIASAHKSAKKQMKKADMKRSDGTFVNPLGRFTISLQARNFVRMAAAYITQFAISLPLAYLFESVTSLAGILAASTKGDLQKAEEIRGKARDIGFAFAEGIAIVTRSIATAGISILQAWTTDVAITVVCNGLKRVFTGTKKWVKGFSGKKLKGEQTYMGHILKAPLKLAWGITTFATQALILEPLYRSLTALGIINPGDDVSKQDSDFVQMLEEQRIKETKDIRTLKSFIELSKDNKNIKEYILELMDKIIKDNPALKGTGEDRAAKLARDHSDQLYDWGLRSAAAAATFVKQVCAFLGSCFAAFRRWVVEGAKDRWHAMGAALQILNPIAAIGKPIFSKDGRFGIKQLNIEASKNSTNRLVLEPSSSYITTSSENFKESLDGLSRSAKAGKYFKRGVEQIGLYLGQLIKVAFEAVPLLIAATIFGQKGVISVERFYQAAGKELWKASCAACQGIEERVKIGMKMLIAGFVPGMTLNFGLQFEDWGSDWVNRMKGIGEKSVRNQETARSRMQKGGGEQEIQKEILQKSSYHKTFRQGAYTLFGMVPAMILSTMGQTVRSVFIGTVGTLAALVFGEWGAEKSLEIAEDIGNAFWSGISAVASHLLSIAEAAVFFVPDWYQNMQDQYSSYREGIQKFTAMCDRSEQFALANEPEYVEIPGLEDYSETIQTTVYGKKKEELNAQQFCESLRTNKEILKIRQRKVGRCFDDLRVCVSDLPKHKQAKALQAIEENRQMAFDRLEALSLAGTSRGGSIRKGANLAISYTSLAANMIFTGIGSAVLGAILSLGGNESKQIGLIVGTQLARATVGGMANLVLNMLYGFSNLSLNQSKQFVANTGFTALDQKESEKLHTILYHQFPRLGKVARGVDRATTSDFSLEDWWNGKGQISTPARVKGKNWLKDSVTSTVEKGEGFVEPAPSLKFIINGGKSEYPPFLGDGLENEFAAV